MPFATFWETIDGNATKPEWAAHKSFVTNIRSQICSAIHGIPDDEQCTFAHETPSCSENSQFVDYISFLYCFPNSTVMMGLKMVALMFLCSYIFMMLGTTADSYFCPALAAISKWLGLSENLAGVTLLAFGNGAPDLFAALSAQHGDSELMFAELLGAASFIIGFIAAVIVLLRPFTVQTTNVLRDAIFYMITSVWLAIVFENERVSLWEANATIALYGMYLAVVLIDHFRIKRKMKRKMSQLQYNLSDSLAAQLRILEQRHVFHIRNSQDSAAPADDESNTASSAGSALWSQFWRSVQPIDAGDWQQAGLLGRAACILKVPIQLSLTLCLPCVDYTLPRNGWSKLLNSGQIVLMPVVMVMLRLGYDIRVWNVPVLAMVAPGCLVLAVIVFCTSGIEEPPRYHMFFAVFTTLGCMCVIATLADELVAIIAALGTVANLSQSYLGLSALAWGNSIGDLIANVALARQGYQRMGFAACFGGPLFNTLLGIGLGFNIRHLAKAADDHNDPAARDGPMGKNCLLFLFIILFFTLASLALSGWQARRSVGVLMMCVYVLFAIYSTMGELEVIHPYGTDHRND